MSPVTVTAEVEVKTASAQETGSACEIGSFRPTAPRATKMAYISASIPGGGSRFSQPPNVIRCPA